MIYKFPNALKYSGKISLAVTVIFFAGMLISTYLLLTLPHDLTLQGGLPTLVLAWPVLINLFVSIGLTFLAGIIALNISLRSRNATVVYLEKKNDDHSTTSQREDAISDALKDISAFKATIETANGESEILQRGLNTLCQQWHAGHVLSTK